MAIQDRRIKLNIARPAINGPSLRWVKRHGRRLAAFSTGYGYLDPLPYPGSLGRRYRRQAVILCLLTFFTAFRRILKVFVAEKCLFARRPNERLAAITADHVAVAKFILFQRNYGCTI